MDTNLAHIELAGSSELSSLGIMHLKRYLQKSLLNKDNKLPPAIKQDEWATDNILLSALGLEIAQTLSFIFSRQPTLEEMERWIVDTVGPPSQETVQKFNNLVLHGGRPVYRSDDAEEAVLTPADIEHWNTHGYVIARNIVPRAECADAVDAVCTFLGIDQYDPATWYSGQLRVNGIKVDMFHHPALQKIRNSRRIRIAFEQLWKRKDIWLKTDSAGFNPPETAAATYQGHRLHWDAALQTPMPFSTQGILYLADTSENQGALAVVPGFHAVIGDWLSALPQGADPREQDLEQLGPKKIAANAGDLIIWHHALPHGSTVNNADKPRFVLYINYVPAEAGIHFTRM